MESTTNPGGVVANPLTFGEKAVGLSFNPGGDEKVREVKELYAKIIDLCNDIVEKEPTYTEHETMSYRGQLLQEAIKQAQGAQMWAVKGITWKS